MPNWDNVYWAIRQGDVPAEAVIKLFACVAWLAWAQIAWALLWELVVNVPRTVRGDPDREAPLTPAPASRLARRLITAAMVLTAISSTPATSAAAPSLQLVRAGRGAAEAVDCTVDAGDRCVRHGPCSGRRHPVGVAVRVRRHRVGHRRALPRRWLRGRRHPARQPASEPVPAAARRTDRAAARGRHGTVRPDREPTDGVAGGG